jgi:hypothetical protein
MSDETKKIYVPRSGCKSVTFQSGKSILKLSFKVQDLIPFLQEHVNEKGYINFGISERREVGQYGDTHCVWLDTWKPKQREAENTTPPASRTPTSTPLAPAADDDRVPF